MIRVERAEEPPDFDAKVRKPGQAWLSRNDEKKGTPDSWRQARTDLRWAFNDRCGYTAMWLSSPGTVDHFVSRDEDRRLAYEWSNLRYAAAWINSSKSALRADQVLDPFEIGDDWFEVILPSCQMIMTERCPSEFHERAKNMLGRLRLGHHEDIVSIRQEWYQMYSEGELTLEGLEKKAPLVARAVRKQKGEGCLAAQPVAPPEALG